MHLASVSAQHRLAGVPSREPSDRRPDEPVAVTLLGRFMRANRQEYPARLTNISPSCAAMIVPVEVELGERIVAYFDHLGGIEGRVVRHLEGGFAMTISASRHKRDKLAAQLARLEDRLEPPAGPRCRHERVVPGRDRAPLKLRADAALPARIRNVSISGALLGTEARPPIGTEALLGRLRCRVVRHDADGIAVEFSDIERTELPRRHPG